MQMQSYETLFTSIILRPSSKKVNFTHSVSPRSSYATAHKTDHHLWIVVASIVKIWVSCKPTK